MCDLSCGARCDPKACSIRVTGSVPVQPCCHGAMIVIRSDLLPGGRLPAINNRQLQQNSLLDDARQEPQRLLSDIPSPFTDDMASF